MLNSKAFKNCLALLLITLVAGLALAFVNEITLKPIETAEYNAKMAGYEEVFQSAEFAEIDNSSQLIDEYNSDKNCSVDDVLAVKDENGNVVGYVMSATSPSGYGGNVTVAIGINCADDSITGMKVLAQSETAGLGARCTEDEFKSQFKTLSANVIAYVKGGNADHTNNEIDAISGATITTNAVTEAVNTATDFYNTMLKEGK